MTIGKERTQHEHEAYRNHLAFTATRHVDRFSPSPLHPTFTRQSARAHLDAQVGYNYRRIAAGAAMTGVVHNWQTSGKRTVGSGKRQDEGEAAQRDEEGETCEDITSGPVLRSYLWRSKWLRDRECAAVEHQDRVVGVGASEKSGGMGSRVDTPPFDPFSRRKSTEVGHSVHKEDLEVNEDGSSELGARKPLAMLKTPNEHICARPPTNQPIESTVKSPANVSDRSAHQPSATSYSRAKALILQSAALPTPDREARRARIRELRQSQCLRA